MLSVFVNTHMERDLSGEEHSEGGKGFRVVIKGFR